MKIWIICSSLADLHLFEVISDYNHEYLVFLDNRFGPWWQLSREDSLNRVSNILNNDIARSCDKMVVPPAYELYYLHNPAAVVFAKPAYKMPSKILPVFTNYLLEHVLPYSIVGKIGLIGYRNHQVSLGKHRNQLISHHVLTSNQNKNKHFQKQLPLYTIATDHWHILYNLPRSWFVNKLIKTDLKKFKDYAVDTLLPLEYGHFKYQKVFLQAFHKTVRFHSQVKLAQSIELLIKDNQTQYAVSVHCSGDTTLLESNKRLMRMLGKGKSTAVIFHHLAL